MNTERFLVVGCNSFSGSHCVSQLLKQDFPVWGVSKSKEPHDIFLPYKWRDDNNSFFFEQVDINKDLQSLLDLIDNNKITNIINFAAQSMVAESWLNPLIWYETNLISQVAFHDELRKRKSIKSYLHFTTPEVYGSTNKKWISENNNFNPTTPYAVSRAACDLHLMSFYKAYDFPVIFTRAANVYGSGQQLYRIIPRTILSCLTGKTMELHGGGLSERSFIHIDDAIRATIKLSLEANAGSSWHISTRESISIKDLVQKICDISSVDFNTIVKVSQDRLGKDQSYLLDSSRLRREFNWKDNIKLENGLKTTKEWIVRNEDIVKSMSWKYSN